MKYLPLFLNLKDRPVLVIGGGRVALRKIQMLHKMGAIVKIVSQTLCLELKEILFDKKIIWFAKKFYPVMLDSVFLVIVATNDINLSTVVFQNAEKRHVLINTVDDQSKCSCIFPAIIDRAPILVSISSCGTAPVLARMLREKLELFLPASIGYLAKIAGVWRDQVKKRIKDIRLKRQFWEKIFSDNYIAFLIDQGNFKGANQILKDSIGNLIDFSNKKRGNVTLVGAGPGDKGLLTIRGLQVMQQADVILYDNLINLDILDLARRDSSKICVGKCAGEHSISQDNLNHFIVQLARQGNKVVRLKGGDSFIFGRGGEELQIVSKAGIDFQVVPGITAGIGVPAYAGIPLTHRNYAHSVTFVTGHKMHDNNNPINWSMLSDSNQTLVIYMGTFNADYISKNLIFHGRHRNTPVAIISKGTYYDQRVLIGTLSNLKKLISFLDKPTLLIIGKVVSLHHEIRWFGNNV